MAAAFRQVFKYIAAICLVTFFIVSIISTLTSAYSYIAFLVDLLPTFSPIAMLTNPFFWVGIVVIGILAVSYGRIVHGNLVSFAVWCVKTTNSVLGNRWFSEPVVKGIVSADAGTWKFEYWTGGEVRAVDPCCPQCGTKVDDKVLPADVVHSSDVGFKPNQDWKDTEAEAWSAVHGAPKSESSTEQVALACSLCRYTSPASKSENIGRESAKKIFERHIERMKSGNPRKDPFIEYKEIASDKNRISEGKPSPEGVWDAYVATQDSPELIPFDDSMNQ